MITLLPCKPRYVILNTGTCLITVSRPFTEGIFYARHNDYEKNNRSSYGNFCLRNNGTFQYMKIFGHSNILFSTIMAELGVQYGWSRIKFYHAVDAGIGVAVSDKTSPYFACNLTWLGIKFRPTEHLWIYAESNIGQKGFVQAGIRVKL